MGGPARSRGAVVNAATGGAEVFWEIAVLWETTVLWGATLAGGIDVVPGRSQAKISPTNTMQMETINRLCCILFSSFQSQFVCYKLHYHCIAILP
jgi:hypothetical protein